MRILERNFRRGRNGEIDIIGRDGKYLVFVEVKYRSGDEKGNAAEAVTTAKQRTICRVADYYRYLHHYGEDTWVRYDVVAIQGDHRADSGSESVQRASVETQVAPAALQ